MLARFNINNHLLAVYIETDYLIIYKIILTYIILTIVLSTYNRPVSIRILKLKSVTHITSLKTDLLVY